MERFLRPTSAIDCDNDSIREKARQLTKVREGAVDKAKSLFYFVRDEIRYNFYVLSDFLEDHRASATLARGQGICVQKAILLAALSRAVGIPTRLRFAVIRNPLASDKIKGILGGDLFVSHGYDELYIEGRWVKAAPIFDREMCQENRLVLVEFDGINDALLPSHNQDGEAHIEYVQDRGFYDDLPLDEVINWRIQGYGPGYYERLRQVIEARNAVGGDNYGNHQDY